jgi:hypothetical protein
MVGCNGFGVAEIKIFNVRGRERKPFSRKLIGNNYFVEKIWGK